MSATFPMSATVVVYLAHGASGTSASMTAHVDGLIERGIAAQPVSLPVGQAERAVESYRGQVADLSVAVIGGHSYGGRVASLLAARAAPSPHGLVLLSYPLHRPGHPEELRTEHWSHITCPVLLLSGDRDPFARAELLRGSLGLLADAELVIYPGIGHGLKPVLDEALDRIARFVGGLSAS